MANLWSGLARLFTRSSSRKAARPRVRARVGLEPLEDRTALSAARPIFLSAPHFGSHFVGGSPFSYFPAPQPPIWMNTPGARLVPVGLAPKINVPDNLRAGQAFTVGLAIWGPDGVLNSAYRGTVRITAPVALGLPTFYTFTAQDGGAHSFAAKGIAAGTYTISISDVAAKISATVTFTVKSNGGITFA